MMGAPADEHVHAERPFPVPRRVVLSNPIAIGKFEITVDQFSAFVATMETSAGTRCRAIVGYTGQLPRGFIIGRRTHHFACRVLRSPEAIQWYASTGMMRRTMWHGSGAEAASRIGCRPKPNGNMPHGQAQRPGTALVMTGSRSARTPDSPIDTPFPLRNGRIRRYSRSHRGRPAQDESVGDFRHAPQRLWNGSKIAGQRTSPKSPLTDPPSCPLRICVTRVIRGGSWANGPLALRSSVRQGLTLERRGNHIGFCVALRLASERPFPSRDAERITSASARNGAGPTQ